MKIKTTLGWVRDTFLRCAQISRKEMRYTWQNGKRIKKGWFGSEFERIPVESDSDYINIMINFHPWSELRGIFNTAQLFPPETEVEVSVEVVGRMNAILKKEHLYAD